MYLKGLNFVDYACGLFTYYMITILFYKQEYKIKIFLKEYSQKELKYFTERKFDFFLNKNCVMI